MEQTSRRMYLTSMGIAEGVEVWSSEYCVHVKYPVGMITVRVSKNCSINGRISACINEKKVLDRQTNNKMLL